MAGLTQPVGFWGHALLVGPQGLKTAMSPDVGVQFSGREALAAVIPVLGALVPELPLPSTAELAKAIDRISSEALVSESLAEVQMRRLAALVSGIPPTDYASASKRAMRTLSIEGIPRDGEAYQSLFRFAEIRQRAFDESAAKPKFHDKYERVGELGKGSQFFVDLVKDRTTETLFVAKRSKDPHALGRILDAVNALKKLDHPHIGPLHELFVEVDPRFETEELILVTPYHPEDVPLSKAIGNGRKFTEIEIQRVVDQLAGALQYAHRQGIIHRDMKPSNVLIRGEGKGIHATLIDFGVAKFDGMETRTSSIMKGTFEYMSPEQLRDETITPAADLHGLGLVAIAMALGEERNAPVNMKPAAGDIERLEKRAAVSALLMGRIGAMVMVDPAERGLTPQLPVLPVARASVASFNVPKEIKASMTLDAMLAAVALLFAINSGPAAANNLLWGGLVAFFHFLSLPGKTPSSMSEENGWMKVTAVSQLVKVLGWILYAFNGEGFSREAFHLMGAFGVAASVLDLFWYQFMHLHMSRKSLKAALHRLQLTEPSPQSPALPAPEAEQILAEIDEDMRREDDGRGM